MIASSAWAQREELTAEKYIEPPEVIKSSVLAPWHTNTNLQNISPDGSRFLLNISDGMPSVETMGQPHRSLAELKIDIEANRQSRLSQRSQIGFKVFNADSGQHVEISAPEGTRVSNASWSPDGSRIAFFAHSPDATHIYVADAQSGEASQLTQTPVLAVHVTSFEWNVDGSKIITVLVPESDQIQANRDVKTHEPKVRLSRNGKTPSRTYRYLLDTPADVRALEEFSTGQLATISVPDGNVKKIGNPGLIRSISADPKADTFRVSYYKKPFSYYVPISQFGYKEVLHDGDGNELAVLNEREVRDGSSPRQANQPNAEKNPKRSIRWRPDGVGISFLQLEPKPEKKSGENKTKGDTKKDNNAKDDDSKKADQPSNGTADKPKTPGDQKQDDGKKTTAKTDKDAVNAKDKDEKDNGKKPAEEKRIDRVMLWKAPFGEKDVEVVFESDKPIVSATYSSDGRWLFITRSKDTPNSRNRGPASNTRRTATPDRSGNPQNRQPAIRTIHAVDLQNNNKEYLVYTGRAAGGGVGRGRFRRSADNSQIVDLMDFDSLDPWYRTMEYEWQPMASSQDNVFEQDDVKNSKNQDAPSKKTSGKNDKSNKDDKKSGDKPTVGAKSGSLMSMMRADGESLVRVSKDGYIYFSGNDRENTGASNSSQGDKKDADKKTNPSKVKKDGDARPKPPRTYIDRVKIETGEVQRIFETAADVYETVLTVDSDEVNKVFTVRQDRTVVPDYFVHDTSSKEQPSPSDSKPDDDMGGDAKSDEKKSDDGKDEPRRLTNNKNFTSWYNKLKVEYIEVTRVDGFKFWVKVTSNPDYGQKLPAMFWFYPREFTDQKSYSDRANRTVKAFKESFRFQRPSTRSMSMLTQLGYVIVEPDMPIVGPAGRMNDNHVTDLRNGLWAVIDALDKRNILDRDRLAIGGHSYGAFGTGNALAHTPFFKAGIAGDGCYNRTLTPMSFQTERRYYWDARETYENMSPLFHANQFNGAMLMYHGMEDANTGTFPINSERMYQALDGLGKPTSLYMYPYEAHGPAAKETILDMWARWVVWLDTYVKNPAQPGEKQEGTNTANAESNRDR